MQAPTNDDRKEVQAPTNDDRKEVQAPRNDEPNNTQASAGDGASAQRAGGVQASAGDGASAQRAGGVQASAGDGASAQRAGGVQASAGDGASAQRAGGVQASAGDGASAQRAGGAQASSYQGGVIAPGLASMTEGLASRTALLPPHRHFEEPERAIGKSTEQAMLAGASLRIPRPRPGDSPQPHARNSLKADPLVVATGGDAPLITRGLQEIAHLAPDLTLEGLRIIAQS